MLVLDELAHPDQIVCLGCGQREISRHNRKCNDCGVTMVFEAAMAKFPRRVAAAQSVEPVKPVLVQLALF